MVLLIILYIAFIALTIVLLVQFVRMCRAITRMKNGSTRQQIRFVDIGLVKKFRLALIILAAAILVVLLWLVGVKDAFFALIIFMELAPNCFILLVALHLSIKAYLKLLAEYPSDSSPTRKSGSIEDSATGEYSPEAERCE